MTTQDKLRVILAGLQTDRAFVAATRNPADADLLAEYDGQIARVLAALER